MAECNLCGFPVGSDACNASHGLKEVRVAPKKPKSTIGEFIRGYYCAVAVLIKEHGCGTEAESLFRQGADRESVLKHADPSDIAVFREHGLLP
jgi:hypothetical protein